MNNNKVGIIDYSISNLTSVHNAFSMLCDKVEIIRNPKDIKEFSHLVLPGVGSFAKGISNIKNLGFYEPIKEVVNEGKPILGICLGMQILAYYGDEFGPNEGLGFLPGRVSLMNLGGSKLRLPHIGWNDVSLKRDSLLLSKDEDNSSFYFVHSYCYSDNEADYVTATTDYSISQVAIVEKENLFGVQFHPEKSQKNGFKVLKNFLTIQ